MKTTGERFKYLADVLYKGNKSELARNLGIKPQSFSKYTAGNVTPGGNILTKANNIGVEIDWLVNGEGYPFQLNKLEPDEQWKRLFIIRRRTMVFHGTPRVAAEMLGVTKEQYRMWELGQKEIPPEIVDRIYAMIQTVVRKEWWYEGKGEMEHKISKLSSYEDINGTREPDVNYPEIVQLPFYKSIRASAGDGLDMDEEKDVVHIPVPKKFIQDQLFASPSDLYLTWSWGDSMYPTLKNRSIVIVNKSMTRPLEGVFLIRIDDSLLVKRLEERQEGLKVISDNKIYEEYIVDPKGKSFKVLGRVVGTIQTL